MATDVQTPDAGYVDFDEYIEFQLRKTKANIKWAEIGLALVWVAIALFGYLLVFVVCDHWLIPGGFGFWPRVGMLLALVTGTAYAVIRHVVYPSFKHVQALYAARLIERADPQLRSGLLNFVDLQRAGYPVNPGVQRALEKRAAVTLAKFDVDSAVDRQPLLRFSWVLLAIVALFGLYAVFSPKDVLTSVRRALIPATNAAAPTVTIIAEVTPGDASVPARSQLVVEADIRGRIPEKVQIVYTTADRNIVDERVDMRLVEEGLPRYRGVVLGENGRGLSQNLTYRIEAGDARTPEYSVAVIQPPSAHVDQIVYAYPNYMQLDAKTVPGGQIDAWLGTTANISATANMPVKSALLVMTDTEDGQAKGEEIPVRITDGTKLQVEYKLEFRTDGTAPKFYSIRVRTEKGEVDPDPTVYSIKIRPDQPPEVALLAPTSDLERPANGFISLVMQASDPDFGLRSLSLRAELPAGHDRFEQRLFQDRPLGQSFRGTYDFPLKSLGLKPGDKFQFWIEARDTRLPVANSRSTPRIEVTIREPISPKEAAEQLAKEKQQQQDQVAQAEPKGDRPEPKEDAEQEKNPDPKPTDTPKKQNPRDRTEPEPAKKPEPQEKPEPEEGAQEDSKLNPDGKDDERALKEALEHAKKYEGQNKQQQPGSQHSPSTQSDPQQTSEPMPDRPMPEQGKSDQPENQPPMNQQPGQQGQGSPGQPQGKPTPGSKAGSKTEPGRDKSADQPQEGAGGDSKQPPDPASNPNQGADTKTGRPKASPQRGSDSAKPKAEQKTDREKPVSDQPPQPEGSTGSSDQRDDPGQSNTKEGKRPQKSGADKKDPNRGQAQSNKSADPKRGDKSDDPPGEKTDGKSPGQKSGAKPSAGKQAPKPEEAEKAGSADKPNQQPANKPSGSSSANQSAKDESAGQSPTEKSAEERARNSGKTSKNEDSSTQPMPGQPMPGQPMPGQTEAEVKSSKPKTDGDSSKSAEQPNNAANSKKSEKGTTGEEKAGAQPNDKAGVKKPQSDDARSAKDKTGEPAKPEQNSSGEKKSANQTRESDTKPEASPKSQTKPGDKGGSKSGEDAKNPQSQPAAKEGGKQGENEKAGAEKQGAEAKGAEKSGAQKSGTKDKRSGEPMPGQEGADGPKPAGEKSAENPPAAAGGKPEDKPGDAPESQPDAQAKPNGDAEKSAEQKSGSKPAPGQDQADKGGGC